MILSSLWYHSGFLCVKFIVDFRVIIMASFGHQISLCRQFTYWTVFLPTVVHFLLCLRCCAPLTNMPKFPAFPAGLLCQPFGIASILLLCLVMLTLNSQ